MPLLIGHPPPLTARQGRERQRYSAEGERLVAGCIPIRWTSSLHGQDTVQILMVSSRGGKGYALPKGGWESDESLEDAARRETIEEAGVRGQLELPCLGRYEFSSGKPDAGGVHKRCAAYMFVMTVSEELGRWPEAHERERVWVSLPGALVHCRYDWMRRALLAFAASRGWHDAELTRSAGAARNAAWTTPDSADSGPGGAQTPGPSASPAESPADSIRVAG